MHNFLKNFVHGLTTRFHRVIPTGSGLAGGVETLRRRTPFGCVRERHSVGIKTASKCLATTLVESAVPSQADR
jgi:hypothetical protein